MTRAIGLNFLKSNLSKYITKLGVARALPQLLKPSADGIMCFSSVNGRLNQMSDDLEKEAKLILKLLSGKCVANVFRPRASELCIECSDGTRFFINTKDCGELDFSITGGESV